jgi:hypothetical protein
MNEKAQKITSPKRDQQTISQQNRFGAILTQARFREEEDKDTLGALSS